MSRVPSRTAVLGAGGLGAIFLLVHLAARAQPAAPPAANADANPAARLHRSARVVPGQEKEARRFAQELLAYMRQHHPQVTVQAFAEKTGEELVMHAFVDATDLNALQAARARYFADAEFLKLFIRARDLFVETSARQSILLAVD